MIDSDKIAGQIQEEMLYAEISNIDPTDLGAISRRHHAVIEMKITEVVKQVKAECATLARGMKSTDTDWDTTFWNQCADRIADSILNT